MPWPTCSVTEGDRPTAIVHGPIPWPLQDGHFAHVNVHVEAAQHPEDPADLVAELQRVLAEGGTFTVWFRREDLADLLAEAFPSTSFEPVGFLTAARGPR